jgi:RNA polymerase sigma factor (sigma-70 family)
MKTAKIKKFSGSSRPSLDELAETYYPAVLDFLRRLGPSEDDAADLAQETFLALAGRAEAAEPINRPGTFLRQMAYRIWRGRRVARMRERRRLERYEPCPAPAAWPEQIVSDEEHARTLRAALETLPAKHRAAVVLIVIEGVSYEKAAESLGAAPKTVSRWRSRGLHRLRKVIAGKDGHGSKTGTVGHEPSALP